MKYILSICALLFALDGVAQARALSKALADSPRAYALFDDVGKPVAWPDLVEAARNADVVLFGEYHDDPIMHWLQTELIRDLLDADIGSFTLHGLASFSVKQVKFRQAYTATIRGKKANVSARQPFKKINATSSMKVEGLSD